MKFSYFRNIKQNSHSRIIRQNDKFTIKSVYKFSEDEFILLAKD